MICTHDTTSICAEQLESHAKMFETNIRVMKGELVRLQHEAKTRENDVKENAEKLKMNKQLPYLVANCIEVTQCTAFHITARCI
jgi:26S proteasome regulatory subunit T5